MDFEDAARRALTPAHWGYMSSGVDDDLTVKRNREGFSRFQLRPRRLVDVTMPDLRVEVFGLTWETPLFLCPVGGQRMFHPDGEVAVARAASAKNTMQVLSTATSAPVEEVAKALKRPLWYQLYMPTTWDGTERLIRGWKPRVARCWSGRSTCWADATWKPPNASGAPTRATARPAIRRRAAAGRSPS